MAWVDISFKKSIGSLSRLKKEYYPVETGGTMNEPLTERLEVFYDLPVLRPATPLYGSEFLLIQTGNRKIYAKITATTNNDFGFTTCQYTVYQLIIRDLAGNTLYDNNNYRFTLQYNKESDTQHYKDTKTGLVIMVDKEEELLAVCPVCEYYGTFRVVPYERVQSEIYVTPNAGFYNVAHEAFLAMGDIKEWDSDPYADAGYAGEAGGEGDFNFTSDEIGIPPKPSVSITNSGFLSLYNPSPSQLDALSRYMWDNSFLTSLVKLRANPLDVIVSLTMLPCSVPSTGVRSMVIGNVDTLINMNVASTQYVDVDCGSINVPSFYNSYLDYSPFTKCELYLPYIGAQTLSMDDLVGKTLGVKYRVDILTGACICYVTVNGNVMYTYSGQCGVSVPLSGENFNTTLSVLGTVTAGAVAYASSPSAVTVASNVLQGGNNLATMKPSFTRSGSISSNIGVLGVQKPYIIYTVPNVSLPENNNKFFGYPLNMTTTLEELKGFTVVDEIRLDGLEITEEERDRLREILRGGVVI